MTELPRSERKRPRTAQFHSSPTQPETGTLGTQAIRRQSQSPSRYCGRDLQ